MHAALAYTELKPGVREALGELHVVERRMAGLEDYFWFLKEQWNRGDDLLVVEHDIVANPQAIQEAIQCPEEWCAWRYEHRNGEFSPALGFARFRRELMAREPDLFDEIGKISDGRGARIQDHSRPRCWQRLDVRIHDILGERGYTWHIHETPVEHRLWSYEEVCF